MHKIFVVEWLDKHNRFLSLRASRVEAEQVILDNILDKAAEEPDDYSDDLVEAVEARDFPRVEELWDGADSEERFYIHELNLDSLHEFEVITDHP
jgi:hypothetical protein